jgi:hypothetical protein
MTFCYGEGGFVEEAKYDSMSGGWSSETVVGPFGVECGNILGAGGEFFLI